MIAILSRRMPRRMRRSTERSARCADHRPWHNRVVDRRLTGFLLAIGAVSSVVFAALSLVAARDGIFDVDRSADALVALTRTGALGVPMEAISLLGQASALIPLIVVASVVLWRDRRRWAIALPAIMAGTGAFQLMAKWAVDRPRPNGTPWGFPSGHTITVAVFCGLVAYVVCTSSTRQRWRWPSCALGAGTVLAVAFSRLYLDMHWLSDVGGGLAVGAAYLPVAIWLVEAFPGREVRGPSG